jgi:formylglycine-generating enzyme required for sulfatase activity
MKSSGLLIFTVVLVWRISTGGMAADAPPALDCTGPAGADATTVRTAQKAWAKYLGVEGPERTFSLDRDGEVRVEMVLVPPGNYFRGDGKNAVAITLTRPFWIGKYEVTQQQYAAVAGRNPSHFDQEDTAAYPVDAVSHRQAIAFCERANLLTDGEFRLPTEAEWEYAYRAGTRSTWYNGDDEARVGEIAQYRENNFKQPGKIGTRAPNAFGLHDMAGNLWEIVSDYWTGRYDMRSTVDPIGPESGQGCVTRGGNWGGVAQQVRASNRTRDAETYAGAHLGFRIVHMVTSPKASVVAPGMLDCTGPEGSSGETVLAAQRAWGKHLGVASHEKLFPLDKDREVTVRMVLVPPGKYYQGNPKNAVVVTLAKPLWIGKYEVTQHQYAAMVGENPSHFKRVGEDAKLCPVDMVSYLDTVAFCKKATEQTGAHYRLPTEAEWEYAYRAGTKTKFYNGDDNEQSLDIAQGTDNNFVSTTRYGTKLPNAFGIYDMAGNVWERCSDYWNPSYEPVKATDPQGPKSGFARAQRGGGWDTYCRTCNATSRSGSTEAYAGSQTGFRLTRVP